MALSTSNELSRKKRPKPDYPVSASSFMDATLDPEGSLTSNCLVAESNLARAIINARVSIQVGFGPAYFLYF